MPRARGIARSSPPSSRGNALRDAALAQSETTREALDALRAPAWRASLRPGWSSTPQHGDHSGLRPVRHQSAIVLRRIRKYMANDEGIVDPSPDGMTRSLFSPRRLSSGDIRRGDREPSLVEAGARRPWRRRRGTTSADGEEGWSPARSRPATPGFWEGWDRRARNRRSTVGSRNGYQPQVSVMGHQARDLASAAGGRGVYNPGGLGLGAGRLHPGLGRLHGGQGWAHRAQQVAGHPVRVRPDPLQHHPPRHRRDAAAAAVPHRRAAGGVQDRDPDRPHRAARDIAYAALFLYLRQCVLFATAPR